MTMTEKQKFILRSEPRYKVAAGQQIPVQVELDDGEMWHGTVVDLSRHGAKLSFDRPLPDHCDIRLHFRIDQLEFEWTVDSTATWVRPRTADSWWVGCAFSEELPENVLMDLAFAGFLNRRLDPRQGVTININAANESSPEKQARVRLENFSSGGFRLFSPEATDVGKRMLLQFECPDGEIIEIPSDVRWQLPSDGGQFIGCSFVNKDGYVLMIKAMRRLALQDAVEQQHKRNWRPWMWAGLLSAVLTFALLSYLF